MNREGYKTKRQGQPKNKSSNGKSKVPVVAAKEWSTTPKLRDIYNTRTEWATKKLPKVKAQ
jgi:hypothetical protein